MAWDNIGLIHLTNSGLELQIEQIYYFWEACGAITLNRFFYFFACLPDSGHKLTQTHRVMNAGLCKKARFITPHLSDCLSRPEQLRPPFAVPPYSNIPVINTAAPEMSNGGVGREQHLC